jgi:O-antigen ligase
MTVGAPMNIDNDAAHNTMLSMLVELGTIGLALYVGALVVILRRAQSAALQLWGREGAVWVTVFGATYFLEAQFAVAHEPTTNLILFGVMGAIAGLVRHAPAGSTA